MDLPLDLERLLKLRLIFARHGEMDSACWGNTDVVLGHKGNLLMSRGFPNLLAESSCWASDVQSGQEVKHA